MQPRHAIPRNETFLGILLCLLVSPVFAATPLARFTVSAGDHDRLDLPISVDLSGQPFGFAGDTYRLVEMTDGRSVQTPVQLEASSPPRLWWILAGKTAANTQRRFELYADGEIATCAMVAEKTDKTLLLKQDDTQVLSYNHALIPPPPLSKMGDKFKDTRKLYYRSAFIHPLWSPSGSVLTHIHPDDHYHHVGIWMPWTHTQFKGKPVDFWNLGAGQGTVRFKRIIQTTNGPVFGGFQVEHDHVVLNDVEDESDDIVALKEVWDVRVYNVGGPGQGYWLWDFVSTQRCVADTPLLLEAYRYGGFGFRGAAEWDEDSAAYLTSEGKNRKDGHATTARWCDTSGISDGQWKGMTFFSNPHNPRHPEPMRIWPEGQVFFNWVPIQKEPLEMVPGDDHRFHYRQYVHEGKVDVARTEQLWQAYAQPPQVEIAQVKPANAVQLFDGSGFDHWTTGSNKKIAWKLDGDTMTIVPKKSGSLLTKKSYRDFKLHAEFKIPQLPDNIKGQGRGNSGIYIQQRYEVQILDSYGLKLQPNDCASLYKQRPPDHNVCRMPGRWQSYDIIFHAARYEGDKKVKNARITLWHNGVKVHDDVEIKNKTGAGQKEGPRDRPILLQDHGNPVSFRNIWIASL